MKTDLTLGAHMSASGGSDKALRRGFAIGCTAIQLFTSNQKQWRPRQISDEEKLQWQQAREETGIKTVMSHNSYLTNLGSDKKEILEKSLDAFSHEIMRCQLLEIPYLNFHPGVATCGDKEACLARIVTSLQSMEQLLAKGSTRLLLETTAGQGNSVGHSFSQLAYIVNAVKTTIPIGICIDTCHSFAAGYDLRTEETFHQLLEEFDQVIGLSHLYAFHLNDSKKPLGSKRDRHASLGEGEIGIKAFELIVSDPRTKQLAMYLETPDPEKYEAEITLLRNYAKNHS